MNKEIKDKEQIMNNNQNIIAKEDYYALAGKFSYGGRVKNYGLFIILLNYDSKNTIKTTALLSSRKEVGEVDLATDLFNVEIEELIKSFGYKENNFKLELMNHLQTDTIIKITDKLNNKKELQLLLKELIENILQEQINLDFIVKGINKFQINKMYPELFAVESEVEDIIVEGEVELEDNNQDGLNIDIKLNCLAVISPVKGKKAGELSIGENIAVTISDQREISQSIGELLERDQEHIIGRVESINLKGDSERFELLLQFKPNIYGRLVVDSQVKIKTIGDSYNNEVSNSKQEIDQNLVLIVFGGLMFLIFLIITIIYIL